MFVCLCLRHDASLWRVVCNRFVSHRFHELVVIAETMSRSSDGVRPASGSTDDNGGANWSSPYTDRNVSHSTMYSTSGKG